MDHSASRPHPASRGRRVSPALLRILLFLGAAVLLRLPWAAAAAAQQGRTLSIESFDVRLTVEESGAVEVAEAIRFRFDGSWNGVYRLIPVEYRTPQGFAYDLDLDVESVTGAGGEALRYEQSRERHQRKIKIWVPGARDATKTVNIRYRSPNALRFFDEHDELYWNVTGDEWAVPIRAASALVELPEGVTGLRAAAFTGGHGSTERDASIQELEEGFYFEATRELGYREGLTVVVGWDPGVVSRPTATDRVIRTLRANSLLLIPVIVLVLMWWLWNARGKDPRRRPVMPEYQPPEGLTPGEVGTLVDGRPDTRDVVATLVDLAVRGHIRIEEHEEELLLGVIKNTDYAFVRVTERETWKELHPHERALLYALFSGYKRKQEVRLSELKNEFYKDLPGIRDKLFDSLLDMGYYQERPDRVRRRWLIGASLILFVGLFGAFLTAQAFLLPLGTLLVTVVLTALIVGVFGWLMPARTRSGARKLEEILGFEDFLSRVEEDRFKRMVDGPETFEAYLPYAMALGVEEKWAKAFEDLVREPPDWYGGQGVGTFRPTHFVGRMGSMQAAAGSAMTSAPRSSGGSGFSSGGFSGGGSSGGGFGGGGGGGF